MIGRQIRVYTIVYTILIYSLIISPLVVNATTKEITPRTSRSIDTTPINTIGSSINYVYNSSGKSQEYFFEIFLDLSYLNYFTFHFSSSGDPSSMAGIKVELNILTLNKSLSCKILSTLQDTLNHSLSFSLLLDMPFNGLASIVITAEGKSAIGQTGSLTLYNTSGFEKLNIPTVATKENFTQQLVVTPPTYYTESAPYSSISFTISSGIIIKSSASKDIETVETNILLTLDSNDFDAFSSTLTLKINDTKYGSQTNYNTITNWEFQGNLSTGLNIIEFSFKISFLKTVLTIENFDLIVNYEKVDKEIPDDSENPPDPEPEPDPDPIEDYISKIEWDKQLSAKIDITDYKPSYIYENSVFRLSFNYSCEGSRFYAGIDVYIEQNSAYIAKSQIVYSEQSTNKNKLIIEGYSLKFTAPIFLILQGESFGKGHFYIYNDLRLEAKKIETLSTTVSKELIGTPEEVQVSSTIKFKTVELYDVLEIANPGEDYSLTVNMVWTEINAIPVDKVSLAIYLDNTIISDKTKTIDPFQFSFNFIIPQGLAELLFKLTFQGEGSHLLLTSFVYDLSIISRGFDDLSADTILAQIVNNQQQIIQGGAIIAIWIVLIILPRVILKKKKDSVSTKSVASSHHYILEV